jgi:ABC-type glycerol-3-phosphate transport system permease component
MRIKCKSMVRFCNLLAAPACTSLAMLPALLFFSFAERQIVGGLQGAVKG